MTASAHHVIGPLAGRRTPVQGRTRSETGPPIAETTWAGRLGNVVRLLRPVFTRAAENGRTRAGVARLLGHENTALVL